jgi:Uma2 family endonuclease
MTNSLVHTGDDAWTVDDLEQLPDDGNRYELFDGSLLVSPHARIRHGRVAGRLHRLVDAQLPAGLVAWQDLGVNIAHQTTYYVPDVVVIAESALENDDEAYLTPADVRVAIEVLSPGNKGRDLVLKRRDYARAGIAHYWIVDPEARSLIVLRGRDGVYDEVTTVIAGHTWQTDEPFPLAIDPADFC